VALLAVGVLGGKMPVRWASFVAPSGRRLLVEIGRSNQG